MTKALEITLAVNGCLNCSCCPQSALGEVYKSDKRRFTMEDFKTIVDKLPLDCRFDFSGFNEPLLHPLFADFLKYVASKGLEINLYTTLVGLTDAKLSAIRQSKIAHIRLHVPNQTEFIYDTDKWLALFDTFLLSGHRYTAMSLYDVDPRITEALNDLGVPIERPPILSRAGNLGWQGEGYPIKGAVTCNAERWHQNECLPNGDVYLCSMDWSLKMPVGNLLTQSFEEVFEAAEKYRLELNPADDSPCRSCDWSKPA